MRSIENNFRSIQKKNPYWSSYICFVGTIKGRGYTRRSVREAFNKLVDKGDYDEAEKMNIIAELQEFANRPEDNQKRG